MKKFFEGASIVTAVFLVITVAAAFFFNVKLKKDRSKKKYHIEKKEERKKQRISQISQQQFQEMKAKKSTEEDLEYQRKMNDPLWRYYDKEADEVKVLPGKYGVDNPPGRP